MKKIILSVAVAVATILSTEVSAQEYKPAAGQNTLELQLAPLGANPFSMGGIRFRHFMSETSALRATVYVGYMNKTDITQQADDATGAKELKDKNSSFEIGIRPGIEKHMAGTDRLSPYVGAEVDFAVKTSKKTVESQAGTDIEKTVTKNADGFSRVGLNAVFGADYYIAEKVFLGGELGFGFSYTKNSKETVTPPAGSSVETKKGGEFAIAPNVLAQFRLGIVF